MCGVGPGVVSDSDYAETGNTSNGLTSCDIADVLPCSIV